MEVKSNQSTDLRPEGARTLDAPLVSIDLNDFMNQIKSESPWKDGDRNAMTVYKNKEMRIVLTALHEDAVISKHQADGVLSVQLLEGEINFITDTETVLMKPGHIVTLHRDIPHTVAAIKESVFLLTLAR